MLRTNPRRIGKLSLLAVIIGLASGGAAWVLIHLIGLLSNLALFGRVGWELPSLVDLEPSPRIVVVAVLGVLAVALLAKWSPIIRGHGIPEAMESILIRQSRIAPRTAVAKPLSAAIAIGTGAPFGAEGPIIVTGGSIGSLIGQVIDVSPSERKILLACGAAGGMAATFGAPIASVVLAIELLLFEFSTRAFIPLTISAAVAGGVHSAVFGSGPLFSVPAHDFAGLDQLPLFVPLGIGCGLLAVVIARGLFWFEGLYRKLPIGEFWHPIVGAVGFAAVGLLSPRVLGVGYDVIDDVLASDLALGAVAALALAKLVAWWLALASGTSGGRSRPVLLVSAGFGAVIGELLTGLFPDSGVSAGAFALVAMSATFGAATRATLTSIVFVFELTRDYAAILPLLLASVLADLVGVWLLPATLMTEKLVRRGLRVPTDLHADVMGAVTVETVMSKEVETVPASGAVDDVLEAFQRTGHGAFPIVDESGRVVGIVSRGDVLRTEPEGDVPVLEIGRTHVVTVEPQQTAGEALQLMLTEGIEHLPVIRDGRLVGICTRTDILHARRRQLGDEQLQPGWRRALTRSG